MLKFRFVNSRLRMILLISVQLCMQHATDPIFFDSLRLTKSHVKSDQQFPRKSGTHKKYRELYYRLAESVDE